MGHDDMLASLVVQAEGEGGDLLMIRALIEEAVTIGAARALDRIGLGDRAAEKDVRELRDLLHGWRETKKAARAAAVGWAVRLLVMLLLLGLAMRGDLLPAFWA